MTDSWSTQTKVSCPPTASKIFLLEQENERLCTYILCILSPLDFRQGSGSLQLKYTQKKLQDLTSYLKKVKTKSILAPRLGLEVTHSCLFLTCLQTVLVYHIRSKFLCFWAFKFKVYFFNIFYTKIMGATCH